MGHDCGAALVPYRYRPIKQRGCPKGIDPRTNSRYATEEEIAIAEKAMSDLREFRNSIILVPAPEPHFHGHKIRRVESRNPDWYIEFGRSFWRGPRSFQLKRARVEGALRRVVLGWVRGNGYEVRLLPFLKRWGQGNGR